MLNFCCSEKIYNNQLGNSLHIALVHTQISNIGKKYSADYIVHNFAAASNEFIFVD